MRIQHIINEHNIIDDITDASNEQFSGRTEGIALNISELLSCICAMYKYSKATFPPQKRQKTSGPKFKN
jgi:hypothetical protein